MSKTCVFEDVAPPWRKWPAPTAKKRIYYVGDERLLSRPVVFIAFGSKSFFRANEAVIDTLKICAARNAVVLVSQFGLGLIEQVAQYIGCDVAVMIDKLVTSDVESDRLIASPFCKSPGSHAIATRYRVAYSDVTICVPSRETTVRQDAARFNRWCLVIAPMVDRYVMEINRQRLFSASLLDRLLSDPERELA